MMTSITKTNREHLPLIGLLSIQLLTGMMLTPLNNFGGIYLNEVMNYSLQDVAIVIALGQVVGMVASIVGGSLSDRQGHKWILFWGVSGIAISSLLYIVQVPSIVIILWCLTQASNGLSVVSGQVYLTSASNAGILGMASALYNWGYTIGGAVGIPIATLILGDDDFRSLGFALFGFGLFAVFIAFLLPPVQSDDALDDSTSNTIGYRVLFRRNILMLILLRFLPTCFYGVMTLLPLIIKQQSGSNAAVAAYVTGSSIFATLTQLVAGRLADKYGVKLPTQISFSVILLAILGLIVTGHLLWGLFIFGSLGIGAAWALSTLLPGMVTRTAEPDIRGRVFGSLHLIWTFAMALGTLLGGNLLGISIGLPFMIVGVLNIVALLLTVPFFQMVDRKPASEKAR
jgi:MFS family permease